MNKIKKEVTDKTILHRLNKIEEDLDIFATSDLKTKIKQQEQQITSLNKKIELLEDSKNHIFAILALFFGIFTFIAVDIGFTKSLLTFFNTETIEILILTIVGIIILQGLCCTFIYCFLIKPF